MLRIAIILLLFPFFLAAEQEPTVLFTPPQGWAAVKPEKLENRARAMAVGQSNSHFPPSICLCFDPYEGTLQEFVNEMKQINEEDRVNWRNLGTIQTQAGKANLSQVDIKTEWGEIREMQVTLKKDDHIYVLIASALKEEFPRHYHVFFESLRSLRFTDTAE